MDFVLDDEEDDDLVVGDDVGVGIGAYYILWWHILPTDGDFFADIPWHGDCGGVAVIF